MPCLQRAELFERLGEGLLAALRPRERPLMRPHCDPLPNPNLNPNPDPIQRPVTYTCTGGGSLPAAYARECEAIVAMAANASREGSEALPPDPTAS